MTRPTVISVAITGSVPSKANQPGAPANATEARAPLAVPAA